MSRAERAEQLLDVPDRRRSRAESGERFTTAGERDEQGQEECGSASSLNDAGWAGT
jgi:hypothetical protein